MWPCGFELQSRATKSNLQIKKRRQKGFYESLQMHPILSPTIQIHEVIQKRIISFHAKMIDYPIIQNYKTSTNHSLSNHSMPKGTQSLPMAYQLQTSPLSIRSIIHHSRFNQENLIPFMEMRPQILFFLTIFFFILYLLSPFPLLYFPVGSYLFITNIMNEFLIEYSHF